MNFVYPAHFLPDRVDGGFVVRFPDLPEAITQGETLEACFEEARDCLEEAIAGRMDRWEEIPLPSKVARNSHPKKCPARLVRVVFEEGPSAECAGDALCCF